MSDKRLVAIVPHTHWDREWYSPFQTFRLRLVDVLDELLPMLEADPSYAHFLLDGQMAVVDDYLAVRPEAEDRLRRLAASKRLAMGPWYALPDEFLVSGETIVRDLQLGLRKAARFGGAMQVGYLPDMFGHIAQMPQILRLLGLEHAVVWRGVPRAIDRSGFWWRAPDGSTVRAEYLPEGYGNGAVVPDDAKRLLARVDDFVAEQGDLLIGPVLWMNGTDHLAPQPWLGRVVAEAADIDSAYELRVMGLADYLALAPTDGLPTWDGELRSGARANLLMGVASNRVDVKQAAAVAERTLERMAEPLAALFLDRWPTELLDEAWLGVIRNAAHDSICACSADEVCDAVLVRFAEASRIAEGITERAVAALAAQLAEPGPVVVNPSARARSSIVEVRLPTADAVPGTQLLRARPAESVLQRFDTVAEAAVVARQLEWAPSILTFTLEADDGTTLLSAARADGSLVTAGVRMALDALAHDGPVQLRVTQPPRSTVLARAGTVPGFGWSRWQPGDLDCEPVTLVDGVLDNDLVRISVDPSGATFAIGDHAGLGRLVDDGDCGDTYNWCPPATDTVVDTPERVDVTVLESGPLRARIAVSARYSLPARIEQQSRVGEARLEVITAVELRAGERFARVEVDLDNRARDHRLRAVFPLPQPASSSRAECAFATVERGLTAEGGPTELALPTFPSRRFVGAGGITVAHEGLLEYELVDIRDGAAHALAVTLARCTGMLSQVPMRTRPLPAGPMTALEGPQLQRRLRLRYAVAVGDDVDGFTLADDAFVPLLVGRAPGGGDRAGSGSALTVTGAEVSAVVRDGGQLLVRVFNPSPDPTDVTIEGRRGWLVDLRGRPIEAFEGSFALGPWCIATAALAG